jgi:hypothetical protein
MDELVGFGDGEESAGDVVKMLIWQLKRCFLLFYHYYSDRKQ